MLLNFISLIFFIFKYILLFYDHFITFSYELLNKI